MNIEFVRPTEAESIVLVFRTRAFKKLPSLHRQLIRQLLETIFRPSNVIRTWHCRQSQLRLLIKDDLLDENQLKGIQLVDLQKDFPTYYRHTFPDESVPSFWALGAAVRSIFGESIAPYRRPRHFPQQKPVNQIEFNVFAHRVFDCQAMIKLFTVIALNWTEDQLDQYKRYHQD